MKRIIDSIPAGWYAVTTSGAKTYGNFLSILYFLTTSIAVCISHDHSKLESCGAHYDYVVENIDHVTCEVDDDRLKFSVVV